jgi:methyltransferase (TIGR00027 family)
MSGQLAGVSRTAVWVAMMRASEGVRADRLFDDRLASAFVTAALPTGADAPDVAAGPPGTNEFLAIRTRFYDDQLLSACAAGIRQVVLLAAGLDSRAFRLAWPAGVRLFELDLPQLLDFKEAVLAEHGAVAGCQRTTVAVDLREDWTAALTAAGFDPHAPTAWLAEGLLPYLTMTDNDRLLATITGLSTPGSHLAVDHMDSSATNTRGMRATSDTVRKMGVAWKSTLDDPVGWLAGHGWHATTARVPALGTRYGRPLPESTDLTASNAVILCTATR